MSKYYLITEYDTGDEIVKAHTHFYADSDQEAVEMSGDIMRRMDWAAYLTGLHRGISFDRYGRPYGRRTVMDPLV